MNSPKITPLQPRVESYSICVLPDDHLRWSDYVVYVRRGYGHRWCVKRSPFYVDTSGEEHLLSREDDHDPMPDCFMDLDTALQVATAKAQTRTIRGQTAADVLAAGDAGNTP